MKERPVLFSAPMVQAILEGRKTQTRRILKPQPRDGITETGVVDVARFNLGKGPLRCPHGVPGERLWVRETWASLGPDEPHPEGSFVYRADDGSERYYATRWRPSIHMPRWASRIDLEIVEVRCERLQDIAEEDARSEGASLPPEHPWFIDDDGWNAGTRANALSRPGIKGPHTFAFACLWDKINGARAPWASNPWVFAITFKRVRP